MSRGNAKYLDCSQCPMCKLQPSLKHGAKWGVCHMGENTVYLEKWKEKRIHGIGYIYHSISGCGLFKKAEK